MFDAVASAWRFAVGIPSPVWIALFSLISSYLVYRYRIIALRLRTLSNRAGLVSDDWDRLRAEIDNARHDAKEHREELDQLRDALARERATNQALVVNELRLTHDNNQLTARVEELETKVASLQNALTNALQRQDILGLTSRKKRPSPK